MPYDPAIYLGSAAHYRYGRPAYSPEPEAVLTQLAGLDGTGAGGRSKVRSGAGTALLPFLLFLCPVFLGPDPAMGLSSR
jgi:hypothetical protein